MRVILIGNATTDVPPSLGDYDKVVRMNQGGADHDCDIWVNNLVYSECVPKPLPPRNKELLRLTTLASGKLFPPNWEARTTRWTFEEFKRMTKELRLPRPSTGMMALYYFIKNTDYTIDVAGFSHEGMPVHNWDKERDIFDMYAKQSNIDTIWR